MLGVKEGTKDKGHEVFLSRHPASVSGEVAHICLERQSTLFFFSHFYLSLYLFTAAPGLCCCTLAFSSCREKKDFLLGRGVGYSCGV